MFKEHFEIFVRREGRWIVESVVPDRDLALACADATMVRTQGDAVRVVHTRRGNNGQEITETIYVHEAAHAGEQDRPPESAKAALARLSELLAMPLGDANRGCCVDD
ncbi:MAG: hypothetical protein H6843_01690 [Rhodospirillaceae bacterium]|nr:hypothetical protein [Rhodospirillaceae bacterium]